MFDVKNFSRSLYGVTLMMSLTCTIASEARQSDKFAITGDQVAANIYARNEGQAVSRELSMELIDRRGKIRQRTAMVFRRTLKDMKQKAIFFTGPRLVKDMAFLTHDYEDQEREDQQWLYLPAMRKVRRIPASDRGDYFLGTDFTYNDVKDELKFDPSDYNFELQGYEGKGSKTLYKLYGKVVSEDVAAELGYWSFEAQIDSESWIPVDIKFRDAAGRPVKHVTVTDVGMLDGVWTPIRIKAENFETGHKTVFTYSKISYSQDLDEQLFSTRALRSGGGR